MEAITHNNIVAKLVGAVPEVPADSESVKDNLAYLVFSDLTQFIISLFESEDNKELIQRIFDFIELAASVDDQQVAELLRDSFNELAIKEPQRAKTYMGRFTRKIFQQVVSEVYGDSSIVQKIGRTVRQLREKR